MTEATQGAPEPVSSTAQTGRWVDALLSALASNEDFAREFERTPGRSVHALGIPYDAVASVLQAFREAGHARTGDGPRDMPD